MRRKGKAAKHYDSVKEDRDAWKAGLRPICFVCNETFKHLDIHEILRRSRTREPFQRWNLTLLCRRCHESHEVAASNRESMTRMLARKRFYDPDHYSLTSFVLARDERATEFITEAEVELAAQALGLI